MKTITIVLTLIFGAVLFGNAQIIFHKTYQGVLYGYANQTKDGGYIVTGRTAAGGGSGLIKTDAFGVPQWEKIFQVAGGSVNTNKVLQTPDGGYIVGGGISVTSTFESNFLLIKTNALGDTIWTRSYGAGLDAAMWDTTENFSDVSMTADGGYILCGWQGAFSWPINNEGYVVKVDANGNKQWARTYGGLGGENMSAVRQTTDGGFVMVGSTSSYGQGNFADDVYLLKTNAAGIVQWSRTYGGTGYDTGDDVQQTSDGGYVISGSTDSYGAGFIDSYLIKTNASGDTLWTRVFGGPDLEEPGPVKQTSDGGYVFTGETMSSSGGAGRDFYLVKTDAAGDTLWTKSYGDNNFNYEFGRSVEETADGGYVICGVTTGFVANPGDYDIYMVKTDAVGNAGCFQYPTVTSVTSGAIVDSGSASGITGLSARPSLLVTTITAADSSLCTACIPPVVVVTPPGPVAFCQGDSITLDAGGGYSNYKWSNGDTTRTSKIKNAGSYTVIVSDPCGKDTSIAVLVTVNNTVADAGADVTIVSGSNTTLSGSGGGSYSWSPATGLSCTSCPNPVASPLVPTTYYLTVVKNGCTDIDSVTVTVVFRELFIPNVFSPNGIAPNNLFKIVANGYTDYHLEIYNRWGVKMFESNDQSVVWDGKIMGSGKAASDGTYYFILSIKDSDNKEIIKKDFLTLLR